MGVGDRAPIRGHICGQLLQNDVSDGWADEVDEVGLLGHSASGQMRVYWAGGLGPGIENGINW